MDVTQIGGVHKLKEKIWGVKAFRCFNAEYGEYYTSGTIIVPEGAEIFVPYNKENWTSRDIRSDIITIHSIKKMNPQDRCFNYFYQNKHASAATDTEYEVGKTYKTYMQKYPRFWEKWFGDPDNIHVAGFHFMKTQRLLRDRGFNIHPQFSEDEERALNKLHENWKYH